jgi:mono/diheme cytochrome c family protein
MKIWIFLSAAVLVAAIAAQAPSSTLAAATPQAQAEEQAAEAPSGNPVTGKGLYDSHGCYACHGFEGQGGVAGPRIAPRTLPLEAFVRFVRRPSNQMPLYTDRIVSDEDLGHIHAYLESRPTPPPVESIPLLQE